MISLAAAMITQVIGLERMSSMVTIYRLLTLYTLLTDSKKKEASH